MHLTVTMTNMRHLGASLVALSLSLPQIAHAADADATRDLPLNVVLAPASTATTAQAGTTLDALLADRSPGTWSAAMSDARVEGRASVMLGTFASMDLNDRTGFELSRTHHGNGAVPLTPDTPLHYRLIGATSRAQREYLASQLVGMLPSGAPDAVRPANFEELALIWYFIGWDLDEPLLVAQWGDRRYAFDFDASGTRLTWIERLSTPCFSFRTDDNKVLLKCHCMGIARDGSRWTAKFSPTEDPAICPK